MEITKENLITLKISDIDFSELSANDIIDYLDYLKLEFCEYFSDENTNIGIYLLKSPSKKVYIGQSVDIKSRHRHYQSKNCKDQPVLYNALVKYGWDKFEVLVIENLVGTTDECIQLLNLLEILYIKYYFLTEIIYNLSYGGGSKGKHHPDTINKLKLSKKCIKVDQYSLSGEFVKTWTSINDVCRELSLPSRRNVTSCIRGIQKTCYGYIFIKSGDNLNLEKRVNISFVKIDQYLKDGTLIKTWDSIKDAAHILNINSSGISDCLNNRKKSAGGFYWVKSGEYCDITKFKKVTNNDKSKAIIQLSLSGEFVKEWISTTEAAKQLNIGRSSISQCLNKKTKTSSNYKWIYKNEYNN